MIFFFGCLPIFEMRSIRSVICGALALLCVLVEDGDGMFYNPPQQIYSQANQYTAPSQQSTQAKYQQPTQYQPPYPAQQPTQYQPLNPAQQPTQYQPPNPAQQPTQYQPPNPAQQPTQYQPPNPAQQPTQYQPPNPTQQPTQYQPPNPAQQPPQYQPPNQNQQPTQYPQLYQNQQSNQYQQPNQFQQPHRYPQSNPFQQVNQFQNPSYNTYPQGPMYQNPFQQTPYQQPYQNNSSPFVPTIPPTPPIPKRIPYIPPCQYLSSRPTPRGPNSGPFELETYSGGKTRIERGWPVQVSIKPWEGSQYWFESFTDFIIYAIPVSNAEGGGPEPYKPVGVFWMDPSYARWWSGGRGFKCNRGSQGYDSVGSIDDFTYEIAKSRQSQNLPLRQPMSRQKAQFLWLPSEAAMKASAIMFVAKINIRGEWFKLTSPTWQVYNPPSPEEVFNQRMQQMIGIQRRIRQMEMQADAAEARGSGAQTGAQAV